MLAVVVGAIMLVAAALVSVVLLAVLFGVGAIVVGYLWWKTRALRRQARAFGDDGRTVDVEAVYKDSPDDDASAVGCELKPDRLRQGYADGCKHPNRELPPRGESYGF